MTKQRGPFRETEIRPNWKIALRVWWSINWRALVWGLIGGGVMKLVMRLVGQHNENAVLIAMGVSAVFCMLMEIWFIWHALTHHYGSFRLAVIKQEPVDEAGSAGS